MQRARDQTTLCFPPSFIASKGATTPPPNRNAKREKNSEKWVWLWAVVILLAIFGHERHCGPTLLTLLNSHNDAAAADVVMIESNYLTSACTVYRFCSGVAIVTENQDIDLWRGTEASWVPYSLRAGPSSFASCFGSPYEGVGRTADGYANEGGAWLAAMLTSATSC